MKFFKSKKMLMAVVILLLLILATLLFLKKSALAPKKEIKILDIGLSICTMDLPTSSCGPYGVQVQLETGQVVTYKVEGFTNSDNSRYQEISSRIKEAKEENRTVILKVDDKGYIVSVE